MTTKQQQLNLLTHQESRIVKLNKLFKHDHSTLSASTTTLAKVLRMRNIMTRLQNKMFSIAFN